MADLGIGLVGVGIHGARYASHLLRGDVPDARLAAICRRDVSKGAAFAGENDISFYRDFRDLVSAREVDAVAVVTPSHSHLSVCTAALETGKPVLVEKPVLQSTAEGEQLTKAASEAGVPLMVAQTLRYNKVVRALRDRIESVGRPVRLRMAFRLPASRLYWDSDPGGVARGTILETGVHLFDAARWILRMEPTRVFCTSERIMSHEVEDFFSAELDFGESRARCVAEVAKCCSVRAEPVDLAGDAGHLIGDARTNELSFVGESGREEIDLGPPVHTVQAVLGDFASRLLAGKPISITLEDGLKAVRTAECCFESARLGRYVSLRGQEDGEKTKGGTGG